MPRIRSSPEPAALTIWLEIAHPRDRATTAQSSSRTKTLTCGHRPHVEQILCSQITKTFKDAMPDELKNFQGEQILKQLREADETTLHFSPWGLGGRLDPA